MEGAVVVGQESVGETYKMTINSTFRICRHLDVSVNPIMSSGEHTFTKGKSDILASCAARAVLPLLGGPSRSTDTRPGEEV